MRSTARPRVAVIGVGGAGSAACYHLARAGAEVVGYERFGDLAHARGSSHGASRIIRYTYPDRLYTAMMADAYALWADSEAAAREELFVRSGGLYFGPEDHPEMAAVGDSLRAAGLPHETLGPDDVSRRYPALRLMPGEFAFFQPESGFLRAERCVAAHARLARAHGAELRTGVGVEAVEARPGGGMTVWTAGGAAEGYDRVVVCAGPWMGDLLSRLGLPLSVTRQEWVYLPLGPDAPAADHASGRLPVWIDAATHWYGFPDDGAHPGAVKLALHAPGPPADPECAVPGDAESAALQATQGPIAAARYAAARLPGLSPRAVATGLCLYTNTPDEDFVLDIVPGVPDAYLVSGCSGHGFKFTVLLGRIAADWALGTPYPRDLSRFGLSRFTPAAAGTAR